MTIHSAHLKSMWMPLILLVVLFTSPAMSREDPLPGFFLSLTQAEKPSAKPAWVQPASVAFTINDGAPNSYSVHLNINAATRPKNGLEWFSHAAWDRDNQIKSQQHNLKLGAGFVFERAFAGKSHTPIPGVGAANDVSNAPGLVLTSKFELGFNREVKFNDLITNPILPARERVESIRGTFDVIPWIEEFENEFGGISYAFGLGGSLYYDNILNNVINVGTSLPDKGNVFGGVIKSGIKFSPKNMKSWQLSIGGQIRKGFDATGIRDTDAHSIIKASLDFFVANPPSLNSDDDKKKLFRPAVGIEFTSGEDPLVGLTQQTTLMLALKLGYF
jgi:hypothetical protein